ncbi:MAG: hypothetical protein LBG11_01635 [Bifidobacteriaceae bacterium]|jgi:hypothetical protein|nr:hypothetical protein [Bifidobacteriaceae bacterium]
MAQVTLYLDPQTQQLLEDSARASGVSKSRWVADLIRSAGRRGWPDEFQRLAGAFPDFPLRPDQLDMAVDTPRVDF